MTRLIRVHAGRLVDGTGSPHIVDGAVLIEGERIVAVGPDAAVPTPAEADHRDFPDLTMIPGLVDCHSHLNLPGDGTSIENAAVDGDELLLLRSAENARKALESGVTTLRENGASHRTAFSIKEAIRRGIIRGPRLSISGRPLTVTGGHCWPFGGEADGIDGVRAAVRQLVKEGADWIKVMTTGGGTRNTNPYRASYTPQELRAIVDEAHASGRLTGAHASGMAGILASLDAGFDMIIHCNAYDTEGRHAFRPDVARRIVDQGAWVNPTMHVGRARIWRLERLATQRPLTETETADLARERRSYAERCDNFQGLLAAGVRLVAGSDVGWSYYRFGDFAHEVDAMAEAGMGAAAAFCAATLDCARSMGLDRDVGSLEPGKFADLLLVDGDPTVDIRALERVSAVFLGGEQIR
jgi:imidazolonepropionase-like amidohydrolase